MPRDSGNQRGYITYSIESGQGGANVDGWLMYTHQMSWFQYPVLTASENGIRTGITGKSVFKTVQDVFNFNP